MQFPNDPQSENYWFSNTSESSLSLVSIEEKEEKENSIKKKLKRPSSWFWSVEENNLLEKAVINNTKNDIWKKIDWLPPLAARFVEIGSTRGICSIENKYLRVLKGKKKRCQIEPLPPRAKRILQQQPAPQMPAQKMPTQKQLQEPPQQPPPAQKMPTQKQLHEPPQQLQQHQQHQEQHQEQLQLQHQEEHQEQQQQQQKIQSLVKDLKIVRESNLPSRIKEDVREQIEATIIALCDF
jgi:hypothetical protein